MRQWVAKACIILLLFSFQANAMDEPCPALRLPEELLVRLLTENSPNIGRIIILGYVCMAWNKVLSEDKFWQLVYKKRRGTEEKLFDTMSYKENCQAVLFICHNADNCKLVNYPILIKTNKTIHREITTSANLAFSELEKTFDSALLQKPQVFCSAFGLNGLNVAELEMKSDLVDILKRALSEDVLLIFPAAGTSTSSGGRGRDLYKVYPNVIWTGACDVNGHLFKWSSGGNLAQIGVPSSDGTSSSAISLGLFVSYLRSLRPGITALKMRELIFSAANRPPETQENAFSEGILNCEATIEAVKKYGLNTKCAEQ